MYIFGSKPDLQFQFIKIPKLPKIDVATNPKALKTMNLHGKTINYEIFTHSPNDDVFISSKLLHSEESWSKVAVWQQFQPTWSKKNAIDIGANIGGISLPLARFLQLQNATLFSIEADPMNFALLQQSVKANEMKNVHLFHRAMVDDSMKTKCVSMNSDSKNKGHTDVSFNDCTVKTTTLDEIYQSYKSQMCEVGTMKIDVEGFEGHVLKGGKRFLSECPPCKIYIELDPTYLPKYDMSVQKIIDYMSPLGYKLNNPDGAKAGPGDYIFTYKTMTSCI